MDICYSEIDPFACQWIAQLCEAGAVPPGLVLEGDFQDIPADVFGSFRQAHFFAGIAVWAYALQEAGWPEDVVTWSGSCPCQPFSAAGAGRGFMDERHLWPAWCWLVAQCRPQFIFGEQVSGRNGKTWLDLVFSDLEAIGYTCGAVSWGACGVGAPHIRKRLYWVAHRMGDTDGVGQQEGREATSTMGHGDSFDATGGNGRMAYASSQSAGRLSGKAPREKEQAQLWPDDNGPADGSGARGPWSDCAWVYCADGKHRPVKPGLPLLASRSTNRVGKLRGYGNAIVAEQAIEFIRAVKDTLCL